MNLEFRPEIVQVDHTGKDFGSLTIQQYAGHAGRRSVWVCLCDCGKSVEAKFQDLASGKIKSCGCQLYGTAAEKTLPNTWTGYGEISGTLYSKIRRDAMRRNIIFNVNIEYLWEIFLKQKRQCALTGWDIWFAPVSSAKKDVLRTASLDRINSQVGYVRGNLRWVHKKCNALKMSFSDNELLELVKAIAQHKKLIKSNSRDGK